MVNTMHLLCYELNKDLIKKSIWLPNKAKEVKSNKAVSLCASKGYCAKIKYKLDNKLQEKIVPLDKNAKNITLKPCKTSGRIINASGFYSSF